MKENRNKLHSRRGFTFAELLIVIAIVAALVAIGAVSYVGMQRNMQQAKLDRMAENLYTAAQNQLTLRAARGRSANNELSRGNRVAIVPADLENETQKQYLAGEHKLRYAASSQDVAKLIFPAGSISEEVRAGSWIVEYEPDSYSVYSVFYSEGPAADLVSYYEGGNGSLLTALRGTPKQRGEASHNTVGYYSGNIAYLSDRKVGELQCTLELKNEEELTAAVIVSLPSGTDWTDPMTFAGEELRLSLSVTGKERGTKKLKTVQLGDVTHTLTISDVAGGNTELRFGDFSFTLDSLKSGKSFSKQFSDLIPGEDITVEAVVSCGNNTITLYPDADRKTANSLFANGSGSGTVSVNGSPVMPVYIAYGRHLQNLNTATSDFAPDENIAAVQIENVCFDASSEWARTYAEAGTDNHVKAKNFTPITDAGLVSYNGNGKTIEGLAVSTDGSAGLFAQFAGSELRGITLIDCTFFANAVSDTAAGGLAGKSTGAVTVSNCRLYMDKLCPKSDATNARNMDWMVAENGPAGGLIGEAADDVTIENSFAATVVRGRGYEGGLVGKANGALTVRSSYANCYLSALGGASQIGGLAGGCGGGSSFTDCYSAGFVIHGSGKVTAAGFVPANANVTNSYSIFCFDDATEAEAIDRNGETEYVPKKAGNMTRYALTRGGIYTSAYYTYGDTAETSAQLVSAEELQANADLLADFAGGLDPSRTHRYMLADRRLSLSNAYPYPTIPSLDHYSDFFAVTTQPVKIIGVVLAGVSENPGCNVETRSVSAELNGGIVDATYDKRIAANQAFVGWVDADGLKALQSMSDTKRIELCEQLDALDIVDGRLVSAHDGDLPANFTDASMGALFEAKKNGKIIGVTASERVRETKVLYAVYREVMPFDVIVRFMSFNADLFAKAWDENDVPTAMDFEVTAQKYLGSDCFAIRQEIVYTVNKLQLPNYKAMTVGPYDLLKEVEYNGAIDPDNPNANATGYTVISTDYLNDQYPKVANAEQFAPIACFKPAKATGTMTQIALDAGDWTVNSSVKTLTVRLDQPRIYSVLCSTKMLDVPVRFVFLDCAQEDGSVLSEEFQIKNYPTVEARVAAAKSALKNTFYVAPKEIGAEEAGGKAFDMHVSDGYCITADEVKSTEEGKETVTLENYRKHTVSTLTVHMNLPPNAVVWSEIPEFDGFELMPNEIENKLITEASWQDDKAPMIPYKRILYTLAFDLGSGDEHNSSDRAVCKWPKSENGGLLFEDGSVVVEQSSTMPESISDMHIGQSTAQYLPMSETLCTAADRTTEETARLISRGFLYRPGHSLTGWKFYDLATYGPDSVALGELRLDGTGRLVGDFRMPAQSVVAVAQWSTLEDAPVRVEIYVQNVTDNWRWNLVPDDTEHIDHDHTYSYYNSYSVGTKANPVKLSAYENLSSDALLQKAYTGSGKKPEYAIGNDIREYLRDSITGEVDGTIRSPQLVINESESNIVGDKVTYEMDATGTAVFKLCYDRKIDKYDFAYGAASYERAKKQTDDPGGEGYNDSYYLYSLDEYRGIYYYGNYFLGFLYLGNKAYVLRDDAIDQFVHDFDAARTGVINEDRRYGYQAGEKFFDYFIAAGDSDALIYDKYIFGRKLDVRSGNSTLTCFIPFYDEADIAEALADNYGWHENGLYKRTGIVSIRGLYEQPLSLAYEFGKLDASDTTKWNWPGDGRYSWTPSCPYGQLSSNLTYLSNFYYFEWINGLNRTNARIAESTALNFEGTQTSGDVPVRFYLQKDELRTGLGTDSFNEQPEFTYYGSEGNFTLNDKFDGYTVYGYRADTSTGTITKGVSGASVPYSASLDIFYSRNEYQLIFHDVKGISTQTLLYGETLASLPKIVKKDKDETKTTDEDGIDEDSCRPDSIDKEYHFRGWYTMSDGKGYELIDDETGVYYIDDDVSGEPVYLKMSSGNLTIFADWKPDEVEVKLYSRLPGITDETALLKDEEKAAGKKVYSANVTLYEIIPQNVFGNLMSRWADYSDGIYRSEYQFEGWYRSGDGAPGHDEVLTSRFFETKEHVTKSFSLAAQWRKVSGTAQYYIRCHLLDNAGNPVDTIQFPGGYATIGEPLNVIAPGSSRDSRLDGYYPLKSMSSLEEFKPPLYETVDFYYKIAETWSYQVRYQLLYKSGGTTVASADMTLSEPDVRQSSAENVYVWPKTVAGYRLDPETQQQELMKPVDKTIVQQTKAFTCVLDPESFETNDLVWTQGAAVPEGELWSVTNGTGNSLPCPEGYEIRTSYLDSAGSKRFGSLGELLNPGGSVRKPGSYTVRVSVELWKADGTSSEMTIYQGTSNVKVSSEITLSVGTTSYLLRYDGSSLTPFADGKPLEDILRAAEENAGDGQTFTGFYAPEASAPAIDAGGALNDGQLVQSTSFTARYRQQSATG